MIAVTGATRPMRWWDIEAVAALERRLFPDDAWSLESFWAELARNESRYYVVIERDGAVMAYGGLLAVPGGPDADVLTVAVDPAERGRGRGAAVLGELLAEADRRGCVDVHLEVREGNTAALSLYARHGFVYAGVRRRYYANGDDAIVMRRRRSRTAGEGT